MLSAENVDPVAPQENPATDIEADQSRSIAALAAALAKAQGAMSNALKDSENPHFKSSYADLASIWDACREPLSQNGLAVMQRVRTQLEGVLITTWLVHSSGQWVRDAFLVPVQQRTAQGIGSAITYGRRYALAALVGVAADEDDDGNAASQFSPSARDSQPREHKPKAQAKRNREQLEQALGAAKTKKEVEDLYPELRALPEEEQAILRPIAKAALARVSPRKEAPNAANNR